MFLTNIVKNSTLPTILLYVARYGFACSVYLPLVLYLSRFYVHNFISVSSMGLVNNSFSLNFFMQVEVEATKSTSFWVSFFIFYTLLGKLKEIGLFYRGSIWILTDVRKITEMDPIYYNYKSRGVKLLN